MLMNASHVARAALSLSIVLRQNGPVLKSDIDAKA